MFKNIKNFLFPDDTKIKIESTVDCSFINGRVITSRKFYTLRSIATYFYYEGIKNPIRTLKEIPSLSPHLLQRGAIGYVGVSSNSDNATTLTFSMTTSGSNRALTVGVGSVRTISSCTYNSVSMSATTEESDGTGFARMFYLGDPTSGTNSVVVTLGSSGSLSAGAIAFSGANSASPLDNQVQASVNAATLTMTMTTNYDNSFLVDTVHKQASPTANGSQTLRWSEAPSDFYSGSTKPTTTAGSYSMVWTGTSGVWGGTTIAIREYSAQTNGNFLSFM